MFGVTTGGADCASGWIGVGYQPRCKASPHQGIEYQRWREWNALERAQELNQSIAIFGGVEAIGERAFEGLSELEKVGIPSSATKLNSNSFMDCNKIGPIEVSEAKEAFACDNYTPSTLPSVEFRI